MLTTPVTAPLSNTTRTTTIRTTQEQVDDIILDVLPMQGHWNEEDYLWLTDDTNRLIEYTDGYIEVLPMPTDEHQMVSQNLLLIFLAYIKPRGGVIHYAPLRVRIREKKYREPDLLLFRDADDVRRQNRYWLGADLALEVVSPDNPERDLIEKRSDYAEDGISEYWIVNPLTRIITVLWLETGEYIEHGVFGAGEQATSALLEGFSAEVDAVFSAS